MQINWGIIGCGDVCEVKSGPAFNKVPHSKLVAVMRRNAAKAKDFAARHDVPKFYSDADELINDSAVNAIYIATPPSSHEFYLEQCLKAGKPVYVEKPVSINAASVERMIQLEKQYKVKVSVAHYRRALPLFKNVKALIENGSIGKIKLVLLKTLQAVVKNVIPKTEENWRINTKISGGGYFHDLSPHQLDIMYWVFGAPTATNVIAANQGRHYNAADHVMLQMAFNNEIGFSGTWNFNVAPSAVEDSCEIIGDKGSIHFSFFKPNSVQLTTTDIPELINFEIPAHIQQPHIENVVKYFRGEAPNPCSLEEAWVTMKIMDKAAI